MSELTYLVIDVDGTMTDGSVYYDERGNELKKFNTKDAAGFFAARWAGIKLMVLTGRKCTATSRRMTEMRVDYLFQEVKDKHSFLEHFMFENGITKDSLGYIGDDLNDFSAMQLAGFVACPADSCPEILKIADYISSKKGGNGVIRDVVESYLRERGLWQRAISEIYNCGI